MRHRSLAAVLLFSWCAPAFARSSDSGGLVLFLGIGAIVGMYWLFSTMVANAVERRMTKRMHEIETKERTERTQTAKFAEQERSQMAKLAEQERAHNTALFNQRKTELTALTAAFNVNYITGRTWLANFIAEAFQATDEASARALELKKNPAHKAADEIRRIGREKKDMAQRLKHVEYVLKTYHEYYPVLEQYHDDILNEDATLNLDDEDAESDRVSRYISQQEYDRLKPLERNQLALEKWKARPKSSVEIGRMYERYLGYLYESDGWTVTYFGANEGLEDMGRDLLCIKGSTMHVVQAKYWAKHKTLHEKHIFQLYGTTILLPLTRADLKNIRIKPVFAATTKLSPTAEFAAKQLGVEVRNLDMNKNYPLIKCNVNGKSKIYHLPFDQQYDRVRIDPSRGETYAQTVQEAEKLGFRRAMRHTARAA